MHIIRKKKQEREIWLLAVLERRCIPCRLVSSAAAAASERGIPAGDCRCCPSHPALLLAHSSLPLEQSKLGRQISFSCKADQTTSSRASRLISVEGPSSDGLSRLLCRSLELTILIFDTIRVGLRRFCSRLFSLSRSLPFPCVPLLIPRRRTLVYAVPATHDRFSLSRQSCL